jgi:hypothetical protein
MLNLKRAEVQGLLPQIALGDPRAVAAAVEFLTRGPKKLQSATAVLTKADLNRTLLADRAAGITVTLPAAVGSGDKARVVVATTITSNNLIVKVADATDVMQGQATLAQDAGDTSVMFEAAATDDTITMNGSTTGGLKGAVIELEDVDTNLWQVTVRSAATGTEATPFSATVS